MRLKNKIVLVTGAANGIGKATSLKLVEEGSTVVLLDLEESGINKLADDINASGGVALPIKMDVTSRASWNEAITIVIEKFAYIHGLVNNAGVTRDRSLLKMTDDEWQTVMDVNLRGTWLGCQLVVPVMKESGGSIVNLSSESRWGAFGQSNYAASKSGLVGLTRTISFEHARHNIRVNAVAPGSTKTEMVNAISDDIKNSWLEAIPMNRFAEPAEIASVIVFLLSDEASYVTGQIIGVNGGSSI